MAEKFPVLCFYKSEQIYVERMFFCFSKLYADIYVVLPFAFAEMYQILETLPCVGKTKAKTVRKLLKGFAKLPKTFVHLSSSCNFTSVKQQSSANHSITK